ncbi:hypothetical protein ACJX0J_022818, partial [Zea mays]
PLRMSKTFTFVRSALSVFFFILEKEKKAVALIWLDLFKCVNHIYTRQVLLLFPAFVLMVETWMKPHPDCFSEVYTVQEFSCYVPNRWDQ